MIYLQKAAVWGTVLGVIYLFIYPYALQPILHKIL